MLLYGFFLLEKSLKNKTKKYFERLIKKRRYAISAIQALSMCGHVLLSFFLSISVEKSVSVRDKNVRLRWILNWSSLFEIAVECLNGETRKEAKTNNADDNDDDIDIVIDVVCAYEIVKTKVNTNIMGICTWDIFDI